MNKILKIEILIALILSFLIVFSSMFGMTTYNYIEFLKIIEIVIIVFNFILLLFIKEEKVGINKFDIIGIAIYLSLLILIILRGYFSSNINYSYYLEGPFKRMMYFNYYSYVLMFPTTILTGYIITTYVKIRKKQK